MPDRMDRGSPKSSSNSSAFMSILLVFCGAARFVEVGGWLCLLWGLGCGGGARTAGLPAAYEDGSAGRLRCAHRLARPEAIRPRRFSHRAPVLSKRLALFRLVLVLSRRSAAAEAQRALLRNRFFFLVCLRR
jgi:hypothetical protein